MSSARRGRSSPNHGHSRRRPVGSGCSRLAAAGVARRLRRAVGRDPRAAPRAPASGEVTSNRPAFSVAAGWPASSRRTPDGGRRWSPLVRGRDTDSTGRPLASDLGWQPGSGADSSTGRRPLAGRTPPGTVSGAPGPRAFDLPTGSLFGHTRLSVTEIDLLSALAAERDVHIWLPHPSPALWAALAVAAAPSSARRRQLPGRPPSVAVEPGTRPRGSRGAGARRGGDRRRGAPDLCRRCSGGCRRYLADDPRPAGGITAPATGRSGARLPRRRPAGRRTPPGAARPARRRLALEPRECS